MADVLAGLLTPAVLKVACHKLSSVIAEQTNLSSNFQDELQYMKDTLESIVAELKDTRNQAMKSESFKQLKYAALDISDIVDDYQDTDSALDISRMMMDDIQDTAKMPGMLTNFPTFAYLQKMVLANKMKNMRQKLTIINEYLHQTNEFQPRSTAIQYQQIYDERETTSDVNEARVFGRHVEKKEIIDILSASHRKDGTMVLPIYGLGGMGKSTLAQLVYNDTQLQYDNRVWVYVSQVFDLKNMGRSILSQLTALGGHRNLDSLQLINHSIQKLLHNKKILIVLDDIWVEDPSELDKLKHILHTGWKGSMTDVLVTTRSESIAYKVCTNEPYKLQPLTHNVCWDIIKICSGFMYKSNKQKLEEIGFDIAKKCGGLPLAAQAFGYMLHNVDLVEWSYMNNNDIWNILLHSDDDSPLKKVVHSLQLSFELMPLIFRLCFSYCAIFPKGHGIYEDDLVHQWIALGFIRKKSEGKKCIRRLFGMSFLQHSKLLTNSGGNMMRYTMADLVHDMARAAIGDELIVIDAVVKVKTSEQEYCRYTLIINYDGQTELSDIISQKIQALHFSNSKLGTHDGSFTFLKRLRILDFSGCSGILLPSSVGQLKQLKCLIAPELRDKTLPKAICGLSKLQYLNLRGSSLISTLPESIGKLSSLIYLCLSGCYGIKQIPESLVGLNKLQLLNLSCCSSITRLPERIGSLNNMQYLYLNSNGQIKELPRSFQNLQNLMLLDLSECHVKGLLEALPGLTQLRHLNMFDFDVDDWLSEDLFDAMGNLTNLKYLNLAHVKCPISFSVQ